MFYTLKKGLLYIIILSRNVFIFGITLDILKMNIIQIYLMKIIVISIFKGVLTFNRVNFHSNQFYNGLKLIKI